MFRNVTKTGEGLFKVGGFEADASWEITASEPFLDGAWGTGTVTKVVVTLGSLSDEQKTALENFRNSHKSRTQADFSTGGSQRCGVLKDVEPPHGVPVKLLFDCT
jgi:hypothetical protein